VSESPSRSRRHRVGAQWRKAPLVLRHHPSVLLAVLAAAALVALAAASSPFVRVAAGSVALKNKLAEYSAFSAGLEVSSIEPRSHRPERIAQSLREAQVRDVAVQELARRIGFIATPVVTTLAPAAGALNASSDRGFTQLRLMAREGALENVTVLSRTGGHGLWISHLAANALGVKAGDRFELVGSDYSGGGRNVGVRVKGVYRALAYEEERPFWSNFFADIFSSDPDSPPPPTFAFGDRRDVVALVKAVGGLSVETVYELPVDPRRLTLDEARSLAERFDLVDRTLARPRGALARTLHCTPEFASFVIGSRSGCGVSSSLPSAVTVAESDVSAVSPVVRLLSSVGMGIALAVAAAVGVFAVRRRRVEAALSFSRGEHAASFAARTALEALVPVAVGATAGFAVAWALTGMLAPDGALNATTFRAAAWQAAAAVAAAVALLTLTAALAYLRLYDTGLRPRRWPRWLVWELPLLAVAAYLLIRVERGGGLAGSGSSGTQHPTLAVFVFPLLLVAGAAGLAVRVVRPLLRRPWGRRLAVPPYLALRRLGAARGLLVVLTVVSAVAFGTCFYAQTLAASLDETTELKAYTANGSDASTIVSEATQLPRSFPFPAAKVVLAPTGAAANGVTGDQVDVLVADPRALAGVLHWQDAWGADPAPLLERLASAPATPLPVIATGKTPPLHRLFFQGSPIRVKRIGTVGSFPGTTEKPLVITSYAALARAARAAHVLDPLDVAPAYLWVKGPPAEIGPALRQARVDTYYLTTVDDFRQSPHVLLATRTYGYLRTIAIAAGLLVLIGLLLYLQSRQRAQTIASALGRRMGLSRRAEALSLYLELAAILLFAAAVGAGVAITAAQPIVKHIDPLPERLPGPVFVVPVTTVLLVLVGLALLAGAAAAATSWLARRADVAEALRVA
jgi:putative ABC transport system permease protein